LIDRPAVEPELVASMHSSNGYPPEWSFQNDRVLRNGIKKALPGRRSSSRRRSHDVAPPAHGLVEGRPQLLVADVP
jgi:hypothetical protein